MTILLGRLKTFAKRVHRSLKHGARGEPARGMTRRDNSMPVEVAQVLYDLAGALALCRHGRPDHRPERRSLPQERHLGAQSAMDRYPTPAGLLRRPQAARSNREVVDVESSRPETWNEG